MLLIGIKRKDIKRKYIKQQRLSFTHKKIILFTFQKLRCYAPRKRSLRFYSCDNEKDFLGRGKRIKLKTLKQCLKTDFLMTVIKMSIKSDGLYSWVYGY